MNQTTRFTFVQIPPILTLFSLRDGAISFDGLLLLAARARRARCAEGKRFDELCHPPVCPFCRANFDGRGAARRLCHGPAFAPASGPCLVCRSGSPSTTPDIGHALLIYIWKERSSGGHHEIESQTLDWTICRQRLDQRCCGGTNVRAGRDGVDALGNEMVSAGRLGIAGHGAN